ncbi:hypothetical protein [Rhizobium sp. RU36D]|uniref:hypothetical protein n=1 Tax=Rhizobium sp. RU36D TaxID=1907415 RepID=UPI0009D7EFF0|nr:hypothetical protein [Rhizobium sp. RU36D]SMD18601.1 hypothetical protein SAMN05880593_13545 [Rhizobium sp. RU36D]
MTHTHTTTRSTGVTRNTVTDMADFMRAHPGCTGSDLLAHFSQSEINRHASSAAAMAQEASTRLIA